MRGKDICRIHFLLLLFLFLIFFVAACSSINVGVPQWSGSGFLRKEFLEYKSVAVLPFEGDDAGEVSDAFAESFHERFPQILILDRKRVPEMLGSTITLKRYDDTALEKIGRALGVQAVITGNVYYPSIVNWFLQVEIVDTQTGKMMGRSMVEINFMGAEGKKKGALFAVHKLTLW